MGEVEAVPLEGAVRSSDYYPEVNKRYLQNLGIGAIPVLVAENSGEVRILKGNSQIMQYLESSCRKQSVPEEIPQQSSIISDQSSMLSPGVYSTAPPEDESCGVDVECEDDQQEQGAQ